jgi:hypothetical protein
MPTKTVINAAKLKELLATMIDYCPNLMEAACDMPLFNEVFPEEPAPKWEPEKNEKYYYITDTGNISTMHWDYAEFDRRIFAFGNCFQTREAAEQAREAIKVALSNLK